jgi:Zn finger protein HypA/HybF involved in hydrogenase expression
MAKCPNCKKEITQVLRCEIANVVSLMYLDEGGEVRLKEQSFEPEAVEFLCPECNERLFDSSEDAENFLKGLPPKGEEESRPHYP